MNTTAMFEKHIDNLDILRSDMNKVTIPDGFTYQLPPATFAELGGEFLNYTKGKELFVSFFTHKKYSNPQGTFQGGMIAACFDDAFGPLGIVASKNPVVSIDMNIQYVRAVKLSSTIYIKATVVSMSRTLLFLRADMYNEKMKLLAQASSNLNILRK